MSRLYRGLWQVEARFGDHLRMEPFTAALTYEDAERLAPTLGEEGALSVILRRVPYSRARWEYAAPFEATDNPSWGEP